MRCEESGIDEQKWCRRGGWGCVARERLCLCVAATQKVGRAVKCRGCWWVVVEAGFEDFWMLIYRLGTLENLVPAGSYIDHSVLLADDNGRFSDWTG